MNYINSSEERAALEREIWGDTPDVPATEDLVAGDDWTVDCWDYDDPKGPIVMRAISAELGLHHDFKIDRQQAIGVAAILLNLAVTTVDRTRK
jgi:hypothetical protein